MADLPGGEGSGVQRGPSSKWWIWLVVAAVVAGILFYVVPVAFLLVPRGLSEAYKVSDMNDLRQIATLAAFPFDLAGKQCPLAPDGRIDVYELLKQAGPGQDELLDICRSERADCGPSLAEIEAGDYRNFPYQRRRGTFDPGSSEPVPVVWEREPKGGEWLVGYSSGAVRAEEESLMREYLRAHPEQK